MHHVQQKEVTKTKHIQSLALLTDACTCTHTIVRQRRAKRQIRRDEKEVICSDMAGNYFLCTWGCIVNWSLLRLLSILGVALRTELQNTLIPIYIRHNLSLSRTHTHTWTQRLLWIPTVYCTSNSWTTLDNILLFNPHIVMNNAALWKGGIGRLHPLNQSPGDWRVESVTESSWARSLKRAM